MKDQNNTNVKISQNKKTLIVTKNGVYEAPAPGQYTVFRRGSDALNAQSVSMVDLFDTFSISAELLYGQNQDTGILQVEVRREGGANPKVEKFTLRRTSPVAVDPFVKGDTEKRSYRIRWITGAEVGNWGEWRDATGETDTVFLTLSDLPKKQ